MGAPKITSDAAQILKLQNAVNFMDCLAQGGFSEIKAIAQLALKSLETPDGWHHLDTIAQALNAIWSKAESVENCINSEAEQVGCNYVDEAERRRWAAHSAARQKGA